ncbi:MAG: ATP-binding protein [Ignavibacteriaceae bacterium]|nr:ATP-binding protein [Ignavibacteriaceae bacterium]
MTAMKKSVLEKLKQYHFEFRHVTVLFIVLFSFQLLVSFINKSSIKSFLNTTQEWYQKESAEEIANLTATAIELAIESINPQTSANGEEERRVIQSFDIIFSQQQLTHNIEKLYLLIEHQDSILCINEGKTLYAVLSRKDVPLSSDASAPEILSHYASLEGGLKSTERIQTLIEDRQNFHIFVPFVIRGEYLGAIYMLISPDFSSISNEVISNYDETSVIYLSLITLGLLAMYFISSYTVKERDETQKMLFDENERNLKKQINYEKELVFTKRIYHTHHKAEKIMGFIKEDLRILAVDNIDEVKYRVTKYSNFISRVIYDMKWYDPPVQTIRNMMFRTNLNEVIMFLKKNIFERVSTVSYANNIHCELDQQMPPVYINEFVIWEIIEPLIQNSIDHSGESDLLIRVTTRYDKEKNLSSLYIEDNGKGISEPLLEPDESGIKLIFTENSTTKPEGFMNAGYGCYIAYEMTKRCGWEIDAENRKEGGCRFIITIKH